MHLTSQMKYFLVVDAMTGQDAVNVAKNFNEAVGITGVVLTKLDGDTRGGAALSIRSVTQKPIKFVGMGEKMDALRTISSRTNGFSNFGMGDVMSLIEKAQANVDEEKAKELEEKFRTQTFTFDDFLDQIAASEKNGSTSMKFLKMMPGANKIKGLGKCESR